MVLSKDDGDLGVRNLNTIAKKNNHDLGWMPNRYVKGKDLESITIKPTIDSAQWKEIIDSKALITQCLDCRQEIQ